MRCFLAISFLFVLITACSPLSTETPANSPVPSEVPPVSTSTQIVPGQKVSPSPEALPNSDWVGAIFHPDGVTEPIIVKLNGASGTLTVQPYIASQKISGVLFDRGRLRFIVTGENEMRFEGNLDSKKITGQVERQGRSDVFVLLPLLDETSAGLDEFSGTYQFGSSEALYIAPSPEYSLSGLDYFWSGLTLTHFGSGAIRGLYPTAKDTFLVGTARVLGYPFAAQIRFIRDASGKVTSLLWQKRDPASGDLNEGQMASRISLQAETVQYTSADGITLTGLLTLPAIPGPHPAILVLHGSERGTRNDFGRQVMSAFMASQGLAVLTYDKRGVGDSGGVYQEAASLSNLTLLAQDAIAGVGYLKSRVEVDSGHIGLIGYSQAGWIIPLAAAKSADIAFFVILSGPVVSVGTEEEYSSYTNNGDSPSPYTSEELSQKLALSSPSGFDPGPVLANLNQPGLWIWGSQDKSIPVPESLNNLELLIAQGKSNFSYLVLPDADHNLQQTTQGLFAEIPYSSGYPGNFHTTLAGWINSHIK